MNMNNFLERSRNNKTLDSEYKVLSDIGFENYFRKINIFMKEKKNMYNIANNDVITNVGCLITNISKDKNKKLGTIYNKTVYLCELEYPETLDSKSVKKNISVCLDKCLVKPMYAFAYNVIETPDNRTIDLGLSLVDLTVNKSSSFGIINFSVDEYPMYKEIVIGENYNPKYYSKRHMELEEGFRRYDGRAITMDEIVDNRTKIIFNKSDIDSVLNFKQNIQQTGIFVDKETINLNEYMSDFFISFLFLPFEQVEFVYDSRLINKLNITSLSSFLKFNQYTTDTFVNELLDKINEKIERLGRKIKGNFYLITRISDQFMMCDLHLFDSSREIRMTKPLHRQYCEYAIDSEMIVNDIEYSGEIAKLDYIDKSMKELSFTRDITSAINMIDSATQSLTMLVESAKKDMQDKFIGSSYNNYIEDNHKQFKKEKLGITDETKK